MEATACPEDHHRAYKLYNMYKVWKKMLYAKYYLV